MRVLVKEIEICEDKVHCVITFANDGQIKVKIEDNELIDLLDVIDDVNCIPYIWYFRMRNIACQTT